MTTEAPISIREVLRLLWEADSYPQLGNEDNRVADRLEREALAKAKHAVPSPDDPPEFSNWLAVLHDRSLPNDDRETVMWTRYDLSDPESDQDEQTGTSHMP